MKIMRFKLLNGGKDGIEIEAKEYLASGKFQIVDDVKRTRRIMLSDELLLEIRKLKYFFLNLTGHWIPPYTNYYDTESRTLLPIDAEGGKAHRLLKDLWNKVVVTGAKANGEGFLLTGTIEVIEGKKMGVSTPFVTSDDDLGFFTEAMEVLDKVARGIADYVHTQAIPIEEAKASVPAKLIEGKTDAEIGEIAAEYLMQKGAIVIMNGSNTPDELPEGTDDHGEVHESTKSIDSKEQPAAEEVGSDDKSGDERSEATEGSDPEPEAEPEPEPKADTEKKEPFGKPAASIPADVSGEIPKPAEAVEAGGPKGEDLSSLEHSQNMGIGADEGDPPSQDDDDW